MKTELLFSLLSKKTKYISGNLFMLDLFALFMLFFIAIVFFYGIIAIHDIPYEVAKKRNHPQQDAIHIAGWVSLFTLHLLWPFLWIWATLYREDRGWGFNHNKDGGTEFNERLLALEQKLHHIEYQIKQHQQEK